MESNLYIDTAARMAPQERMQCIRDYVEIAGWPEELATYLIDMNVQPREVLRALAFTAERKQ